MDEYKVELDESSIKINQLNNINIILKEHQLAIINRCIDIENNNICNFGIMNDKPGTGKTYAILGLIFYTQKKNNIIIVPQNIISQWCESIHMFSNGLLDYKKFIDYNDTYNKLFIDTDIFIIEICSNKKYIHNDFYLHHLCVDKRYIDGNKNTPHEILNNFIIEKQSDEEIENENKELNYSHDMNTKHD